MGSASGSPAKRLDALRAEGSILTSIRDHRWDGTSTGRGGPLAMPTAAILRGPHWSQRDDDQLPRRQAG